MYHINSLLIFAHEANALLRGKRIKTTHLKSKIITSEATNLKEARL